MQQLILVLHVLVALALISLVLLQHGKGADVGAAFGSGAANTMFGSVGPASFLMKLTAILGAVFFVTSIALGFIDSRILSRSQFMAPPIQTQQSIPSTAPLAPIPGTNDLTPPTDFNSKPVDTSPSSAKPSHKK
jgi:preprotein translocase subunit SecG